MRILFIAQNTTAAQAEACIAILRNNLGEGIESQQIALGRGTWWIGHLSAVRRAARQADLIHVFGLRALRAACLVTSLPILYTPLPDDRPHAAARWIRAAVTRRNIHVASLSAVDDRLYVTLGIDPATCRVIRPGVPMGKPPHRDEALRKALGVEPSHRLVLAVGDSEPWADHRLAAHVASILHFMDPTFRLLISGRGQDAQAVLRLNNDWQIKALIDARTRLGRDMSFADLIPAADIALLTAPDRTEISPILACMAGGVPLVAPATHLISEFLEDHHTALLYSPRKARLIAQRILTLTETPELARKLIDQARAQAYELFSVSRYAAEMRATYRDIVASSRGSVSLPSSPPTALEHTPANQ